MKLSIASILLLGAQTIALATDPIHGNDRNAADVLTRIMEENKNLDSSDPRELGMKLRSLLRDEYTFFRGCAAAFYRLSAPLVKDWMADEAGWVLLHGDIHIGNVGTYQGPGEAGRDIRFGVVDLDETIRGPFQLDLLRALTAIRFAVGEKNRAFDENDVAQALCEGYARALSGEETQQNLINRNEAASALLRKAAKNDARKYVARYAEMDPSPHFRTARMKDGQAKDILEPLTEANKEHVVQAVWSYLERGCDPKTRDRFRFQNLDELRSGLLDLARWTRLESSGSQGVHKYFVLLDKPLKSDETPLILELKEQPVPAPAAIGLLPSASGLERAKEVATAYQQMLDPPPRLVGFTEMGDRGFLVRARDPWGEDLEPADFGIGGKNDGAVQAGVLMGEVLGQAHRNGLLRTNRSDQIPAMLDRVADLPDLLRDRSKVIEDQLRRDYQALRADPKAQELVVRAEEYISKFTAAKP